VSGYNGCGRKIATDLFPGPRVKGRVVQMLEKGLKMSMLPPSSSPENPPKRRRTLFTAVKQVPPRGRPGAEGKVVQLLSEMEYTCKLASLPLAGHPACK